jgi:hypothetical protein
MTARDCTVCPFRDTRFESGLRSFIEQRELGHSEEVPAA